MLLPNAASAVGAAEWRIVEPERSIFALAEAAAVVAKAEQQPSDAPVLLHKQTESGILQIAVG